MKPLGQYRIIEMTSGHFYIQQKYVKTVKSIKHKKLFSPNIFEEKKEAVWRTLNAVGDKNKYSDKKTPYGAVNFFTTEFYDTFEQAKDAVARFKRGTIIHNEPF